MVGDDEVGTGGRGRGDDALEGLTLDDSFVRGAALSEGSHRDREKEARRRHRKHRRGNRFRRTGRWIVRVAPLLLAAVILAAAVGFGSRGQGPLGQLDAVRRLGGLEPVEAAAGVEPASTTTSTTSVTTSSTSTTIALTNVSQTPGDCLTWDQALGGPDTRRSETIPCEAEHLLEVSSAYEIDGSPYGPDGPTEAEWDAVRDGECLRRAEELLGYRLDLRGRFQPSMIVPLPPGWRVGDRTVVCGIQAFRPSRNDGLPAHFKLPFVGVVEGVDQSWFWGTGTCLGSSTGELTSGESVPCEGSHLLEVVGTVDLSWIGDAYPGEPFIDEAAKEPCLALAQQVYGGPLPPAVGFGSLDLHESSWAAGRRVIECAIGRRGADGWQPGDGRVRAGVP